MTLDALPRHRRICAAIEWAIVVALFALVFGVLASEAAAQSTRYIYELQTSTAIGWDGRSQITSPSNGAIRLRAANGTSGVALDVGTDGSVSFADGNSDFTATTLGGAIEELVSSNGSGPNATTGKVHWSQIVGMPAGFVDGTDDGASGGSGTLTTVKGNGTQVGGADIVTLDFSSEFGVAESPDTEINITLDSSIARDSEVTAAISALSSVYQPLDSDLTTWAGVTSSANGRSLVSAADYSAMRTLLSLVPGTNVQTQDALLQDIADLTDPGASRVLKWNDTSNEIEWAVDETAGSGGSGTVNSVKGNGTQVGGSDIEVLDFSSDFGVTETPDKEINLTIGSAIARQSAIDDFADAPTANVNFNAGEWLDALGLAALYQPLDSDLTTWAGVTPGTGVATWLATPSSSNLATAVTGETGSGALVFGTSPTIATPTLSGAITASGTSLTGSQATSTLSASATWNTTGTPTAVMVDVTDTASNAASLLMDLKRGGSSAFAVSKFGGLTIADGNGVTIAGSRMRTPAVGTWHFLQSGSPTSSSKLFVNNTWTSDTNQEVGSLQWTTNVFQVGTVKGSGGGTARQLALMTDETNRWTVGATSGHLLPAADSTYNIGASGTEVLNVHADTVTAGALAGGAWTKLQKKTRTFVLFGPTTDAATGDGAAYYPIPPELNGANISYVHLWAVTAGTTGTSDVQIARVRSGSPVDVLSTKVTIDSTEQGSDTAATAAVINTSNDDVATNDVLRVDVDALSTTKPKGLIVTIGFELQ